MRRKTITPERERRLRIEALRYAGDLLYEVVNTYEAFSNLEPDEQKFVDDYIQRLGESLCDRARRLKATDDTGRGT